MARQPPKDSRRKSPAKKCRPAFETQRKGEQLVLERTDGRKAPVLCTTAPIRKRQGEVTGDVVGWQDITELTRAEEALRHSEERFRAFFDLSASGAAMVDVATHKFIGVNQKYCDITGYTGEELLEMTFLDLTHPEDRNQQDPLIPKLKRGEIQDFHLDKRYIRKGGQLVWVHLAVALVRDATGHPAHYIGVVNDITEHKKAEEALHAAQHRMEAHMTNSPLAIIEFDSAFRIVRWSGAAETMFGWKAEEVLGNHFRDFHWVCADDMAMVEECSRDMLNGSRSRNITINRNYRKDGAIMNCEWYNSAIYDQQGRLASVFSQVLDVTQRVRVERALRLAQQQLAQSNANLEHLVQERTVALAERAQLLELSSDAIIVRDLQDRITYWNSGAEEMYGWRRQEACGKVVHQLLQTVFPEPVEGIMTALKHQSRWTGELLHTRRDGSCLIVATRWAQQQGSAGEVVGILESNTDITERKRAEEALRQSQQRYAALHDHAPFAFGLTQYPDGFIREVNEAWEELFECSREEALGKTTVELGLVPDLDARKRMYQQLQQCGSVRDWEMPFSTRSGKRRIGRFTMDLIEINGQKYHLGTVLDITDRKLLEQRVLTAVEEERQRLGRDLHDGLCHCLTAAKFKISLMEDKLARKTKVKPTEAEALEQEINQAIEQARSMAQGLNPVKLLGQSLASALEELAWHTQKTFTVRCIFECPEQVDIADQDTALHLYRIAQEAVHNAIHHGKPRTISIQLQNPADGISLVVRDDGIGFTLTSEQPLGMGLRNMKARAESVGGLFQIQSSQGSGTVVSCTCRPRSKVETLC